MFCRDLKRRPLFLLPVLMKTACKKNRGTVKAVAGVGVGGWGGERGRGEKKINTFSTDEIESYINPDDGGGGDGKGTRGDRSEWMIFVIVFVVVVNDDIRRVLRIRVFRKLSRKRISPGNSL